MRSIILAAVLTVAASPVFAACLNQSVSVTIPMTGEAIVSVYDSATCNQLAGPFTVGIPGSSLNASTKPAFTLDTTGNIHFTANGAPFGTKIPGGTVTFSPDPTKSMPLSITVGGAVTGLVAGTTTP